MAQHDGLALAVGQAPKGRVHARARLRRQQAAIWGRPVVGPIRRRLRGDFAPPSQPIVTQVQRHPVQPGIEARLTRRPFRRLSPGLQHGLLRHILGLDRIAQHPLGQGQDARQLARDKGLGRRGVALPHAPHQILVGVDRRDQIRLFRN